jgi:hypothetical protein
MRNNYPMDGQMVQKRSSRPLPRNKLSSQFLAFFVKIDHALASPSKDTRRRELADMRADG